MIVSCKDQPYTPSGTFGATSPYTGEAYASPGSAYEIRRIGACRRPVHENMDNTALHYSEFICILPIFQLTFDTKIDMMKMP